MGKKFYRPSYPGCPNCKSKETKVKISKDLCWIYCTECLSESQKMDWTLLETFRNQYDPRWRNERIKTALSNAYQAWKQDHMPLSRLLLETPWFDLDSHEPVSCEV